MGQMMIQMSRMVVASPFNFFSVHGHYDTDPCLHRTYLNILISFRCCGVTVHPFIKLLAHPSKRHRSELFWSPLRYFVKIFAFSQYVLGQSPNSNLANPGTQKKAIKVEHRLLRDKEFFVCAAPILLYSIGNIINTIFIRFFCFWIFSRSCSLMRNLRKCPLLQ